MEPKVFSIIVTYNAMKWIDKCLSSLKSSTVPILTVVIDNCSSDSTIDYIKKNYPEVHLIINSQNKGFGQANNQGIEWAYKHGASHFFLLNQDAWIETNTISNIISIQDPNGIDVAVPVHLNGTGNVVDFGYFSNSFKKIGLSKSIACLLKKQMKNYYPLDFLNAAGWVISRKTIEEIGGFDPLFFHYGEDRNYAQRLKYHNKTLAMIPSAIMYHDREQHGNEKVYNQKRVISTLLREYADVNKYKQGLTISRIKLHLWLLKDAFINIGKLNIQVGFNMLKGFFVFFKQKYLIRKSIESNIQIQSNWLNLK